MDVVFSLDSSGAIVGTVHDMFLAYTSVMFAMLTLRAIYFLVDAIITRFTAFQYTVAILLGLIGVKMMIRHFYSIPQTTMCMFLLIMLGISVVSSFIQALWQLYGSRSMKVKEKRHSRGHHGNSKRSSKSGYGRSLKKPMT